MEGQRRRKVAVWAGILALAAGIGVVGLVLRVSGLQNAANVAQLVALGLAVPGLVVPLLAWSRRSRIVASLRPSTVDWAKEVLSRLVRDVWEREARLRSIWPPDPISVRWRLTTRAGVMDHPQLIARGPLRFSGTTDDVAELADQFRRLRRRRLVILGRSGGGKTTLAMQLALELARSPGPQGPAPVIFPLSSWDVERYPVLQDWLAVRLGEEYPALRSPELGGDAPRALAMTGGVLPVLDGLDELAAPARTAVLTALNRSLREDDQLILTCRTEEYDAAVADAGEVLSGAAVIEPDPISPSSAAGYLAICLPPGRDQRWEQVLDRLRRGQETALAELTSVPLGLWLMRAVYIEARPRPDPTRLLSPGLQTPDALRVHMFDELIPAVVHARPPSRVTAENLRPRRQWDPDKVRRWMGMLAYHFASAAAEPDLPGEIAWWRIGAHSLGRRALARASGLVFGGVFALAAGLAGGVVGGAGFGLACAGMSGLIGGGAVAGAAGSWSPIAAAGRGFLKDWIGEEPTNAYLRLHGRMRSLLILTAGAVVHAFTVSLISGLTGGLGIGLAGGTGLVRGAEIGVLVGLVAGVPTGLAQVLLMWAEEPALTRPAITPTTSWRGDRTLTSVRMLLALVAVAAGSALGAHLAPGIADGAVVGFLVATLAAILVASGPHAWLVYVAATFRFARSGQLPLRLMAFLDDAHRLGLLRAVGPAYQFRHAELQQYLVKTFRLDARTTSHMPIR